MLLSLALRAKLVRNSLPLLSINQTSYQSINHSINQSMNQSISQSKRESVATCLSFSQCDSCIRESLSPSAGLSLSVHLSTNHSINQSIHHFINRINFPLPQRELKFSKLVNTLIVESQLQLDAQQWLFMSTVLIRNLFLDFN